MNRRKDELLSGNRVNKRVLDKCKWRNNFPGLKRAMTTMQMFIRETGNKCNDGNATNWPF